MKILGVDLGLVRTGLAVSDAGGFLASPVETITERDAGRLLDKVTQAARRLEAGERLENVVDRKKGY